MKKIASSAAILVILWVLKFGFNVVTASSDFAADTDDGAWIAEQSQWIAEEVSNGSAKPARGWLSAKNHATFEANPQQLNEAIERFHAAGAEKVWVVGIESFGGAELSDTISVELPDDPDVRARLFAVEANLWDEYGTPDVGQRYLTVSLE